ncbi:MAG: hypothetical protein ACYDC1_11170, partial [Limisphaerales bacterium]
SSAPPLIEPASALRSLSTEQLKSALRGSSSRQRHDILRELGTRRTADAREVLLAVVLGKHGNLHREWATSCYLQSLDDKSQAKALLRADSDDAVGRSLAKMYGLPIDSSLLTEIQRLLGSPSLYVRGNCVDLIERDPSGLHGPEKARLMLDSLQSATALPTATQFRNSHGFAVGEWTQLGAFAFNITSTLSEAKGIDPATLEQETPRWSGLVRECLIVARGWRGDRSIKAELLQVMEHGALPELRVLAVHSFQTMAEPADRAVLERIANTDPFAVQIPKGMAAFFEQTRPFAMAVVGASNVVSEEVQVMEIYRIREAARHALQKFDLRNQQRVSPAQ